MRNLLFPLLLCGLLGACIPSAHATEPTVESATETVVTKSQEKLLEQGVSVVERVADAIEKAATKYGDKAVELTLESARLLAIQKVLEASVGVIFFSLSVGLIIWLNIKYVLPLGEYAEAKIPLCGISTIFGLCFTIAAMVNATNLLDVRSWYGIWHPELYISTGIVKKYVD